MTFSFFVKAAIEFDSENHIDFARAANVIDFALEDAANADSSSERLVMERVADYATILDLDGFHQTAKILDIFMKKAQGELWPSSNDRDEKYNAKENNAKTLYQALKAEPKTEFESVVTPYQSGGIALLTRYSPDYPGVPLMRVSDGVYQDFMTRKVYDFNRGFVDESGKVYSGGSVAHQTPASDQYLEFQQVFESSSLRSRPRSASNKIDLNKKGGAGTTRPFELTPENWEDAGEAHRLLEVFVSALSSDSQKDNETLRSKFKMLLNKVGLLGAAHQVLKDSGENLEQIKKMLPVALDIFDEYLINLR